MRLLVFLHRHREHQKIRLLMRQEKTMKPIANHVIDPRYASRRFPEWRSFGS